MKINYRKFKNTDAITVSNLVRKTLLTTNIQDYSKEYIDNDVKKLSPSFFSNKSKYTHCYVFLVKNEIVGTGAIGPYWDKENEFSLFDIFVSPEYQGLGIGRFIIQTLEKDSYFLTAKRVEIPASITALDFYEKMGYSPKNNQQGPDEEKLYRLEKYPSK